MNHVKGAVGSGGTFNKTRTRPKLDFSDYCKYQWKFNVTIGEHSFLLMAGDTGPGEPRSGSRSGTSALMSLLVFVFLNLEKSFRTKWSWDWFSAGSFLRFSASSFSRFKSETFRNIN